MLGLTPELRLLLAASLAEPPTDWNPPADLNWSIFLALVDRHRVAPAACRMLHRLNGVPDRVLVQIREKGARAGRRALAHAVEGARLAKLLAVSGIETMPLKGALLSERLFGDPGMRDVRDIDLLLRPEALLQADGLVRADGYSPTARAGELNPRRLSAVLAHDYHIEYRHGSTGIQVELHWRMKLWSANGIDALWSMSRPRQWMGAPVRELPDIALLPTLCDHGAQHQWFCLKWLADVALLLRAIPQSETDALRRLAGTLDLERPLAQAALLVNRLYGVPFPPGVADPLAGWLADRALCALLGAERDHFASESGRGWFGNRRYESRLRKRVPLSRTLARYGMVWWRFPARPLAWLGRSLFG